MQRFLRNPELTDGQTKDACITTVALLTESSRAKRGIAQTLPGQLLWHYINLAWAIRRTKMVPVLKQPSLGY